MIKHNPLSVSPRLLDHDFGLVPIFRVLILRQYLFLKHLSLVCTCIWTSHFWLVPIFSAQTRFYFQYLDFSLLESHSWGSDCWVVHGFRSLTHGQCQSLGLLLLVILRLLTHGQFQSLRVLTPGLSQSYLYWLLVSPNLQGSGIQLVPVFRLLMLGQFQSFLLWLLVSPSLQGSGSQLAPVFKLLTPSQSQSFLLWLLVSPSLQTSHSWLVLVFWTLTLVQSHSLGL